MTDFNKGQVLDAIAGGFRAFYTVARKNTQKKWKKMPRAHKCAAARALVAIGDLAKNPDKYFSRESTEAAWKLRAAEYAKRNNIAEDWAYYFVDTPTDIIKNKVDAAFIDESKLNDKFYVFCECVRGWYHNESAVGADIVKRACDIRKQADIAQDGRVMYWLMHSKFKNIMLQKPHEKQR